MGEAEVMGDFLARRRREVEEERRRERERLATLRAEPAYSSVPLATMGDVVPRWSRELKALIKEAEDRKAVGGEES